MREREPSALVKDKHHRAHLQSIALLQRDAAAMLLRQRRAVEQHGVRRGQVRQMPLLTRVGHARVLSADGRVQALHMSKRWTFAASEGDGQVGVADLSREVDLLPSILALNDLEPSGKEFECTL